MLRVRAWSSLAPFFFNAPKHFEVCDCQQQYPEGPLESVRAHLLSLPFLDFRFPLGSFPNVYFWIVRCACFSLQQRRNGPLSHVLGWMCDASSLASLEAVIKSTVWEEQWESAALTGELRLLFTLRKC